MSIFDDFLASQSGIEELPLYTELAIDFNTGEILTKDNEVIQLIGTEAILVWVWKALKTDLNRYKAYSNAFGNELSKEIGFVYDRTVKSQLIYSMIEDCLMVNPYITRVYDFESSFDNENLTLDVQFQIETIYGTIDKKEVEKLNVKTSIRN